MNFARHHSRSHGGLPRGADMLCMDGTLAHRAVHVIIGGGANADQLVARLVARWLSEAFGHAYAENRASSDGNLARVAFYDRLHDHFGAGRTFFGVLGVIGSQRDDGGERSAAVPEAAPARPGTAFPDELPFLTQLEALELKFRGLVRAHPSMMAHRVQAIFEDLPGAIEFTRSGRRRPSERLRLVLSGARTSVREVVEQSREASAWYGFGVPSARPADIIATIGTAIDAGLPRAGLRS